MVWLRVVLTYRHTLIGFVGVVLIALLNPFGVRQSSDQLSRDFYERVSSPFYPARGQAEIVEILIDNGTLAAFGVHFPPPFPVYRQIIEGLYAYGARAAFFDVLLATPRGEAGDDAALAETMALMPVLLPRPPALDGECGPANLPLLASAAYAEAYAGISDNSSRVSLRVSDPCAPEGRLSATAEMYRLWCEGRSDCATVDPDRPFVLRWGDRWPEAMNRLHPALAKLGEACPSAADLPLKRAIRRYAGEINGGRTDDLGSCFYHARVRAEWVVDPERFGIDPVALAALFDDKLVLLGTNFVGGGDRRHSSVFADVPGVSVHGMALDNLISLGARVLRPWPEAFAGLGLNDLVELALIAVFTLGGEALRKRLGRSDFRRTLLRAGAALGFLCLIILGWVEPWLAVAGLGGGVLMFGPLLKAPPPSVDDVEGDAARLAASLAWLAFLLLAGLSLGTCVMVATCEGLGYEPVNAVGVIAACLIMVDPMLGRSGDDAAALAGKKAGDTPDQKGDQRCV